MAWFSRSKQEPVVEEEVVEPALPTPPGLNAAGLRSVADHTDYLVSLVDPAPPIGVSLLEAWNQVVCEDINSMINVPSVSAAKIAGYAVRAADLLDDEGHLAAPLEVIDFPEGRLPSGASVIVAPGDALPTGANAVLPTTFATLADGRISLIERVAEGEYARAAGEHLPVGTPLLSEGDVLDERAVGLLASAGIDKVLARPRPRVVVVSSGERLVQPGEPAGINDVVDTNSFLIAAAAKAAGAIVFHVAVSTNDPTALKQTISEQSIRADLIISATGGRREDYAAVVDVMSEIGLVDSVEVAMSPGRTQTFGLVGEERLPMLMLPGNPVSAYVTFQAFGRPLIRRLMGADVSRRAVRATSMTPMRSPAGQLHLLRGAVTREGSVYHVSRVSSPFALGELASSNALIVLDESVEVVRAGEAVSVWLLEEE